MMNPRELLNQQIKGHFIPNELMNRSDESFTFKALDTRSQQMVILKFYPAQESQLLREEVANALRFQASHRGSRVVPVIDFGPHSSGGHWVVTEYQSGRVNLLRHVRSQPQGRLNVTQATAILAALCDSLDSLHDQGLYHGNLKPTNVFLKSDGDVSSLRITDAVGSALCGVHKTESGRVTFNDPTFFSYEQASGKGASALSDVCALGLLGYFMLTGRFPFEGRTTDKLLAAVIIGSGRLKLEASEVDGGERPEGAQLIQLLSSCYAKSTSKRPSKITELKSSLSALGAPSSQPSVELRSAPQTIGPGDPAGVLFGAGGPQTMMYQSVDDESLALLEAARAEFQAEYAEPAQPSFEPKTELGVSSTPTPHETLMSMGKVPVSTEAHRAIQSATLLPAQGTGHGFQTMMGLELSAEEAAQLEELDTTPPEHSPPEPLGAEEPFDFNFNIDALSQSMEEALLEVSGGAEPPHEPNTTLEPSTTLDPSASFEPQTLISAGHAGAPPPPIETFQAIEMPSAPVVAISDDQEDERPYFEMHTTSSPSLELPFNTPAPLERGDQLGEHHVELFSEPARVLPPAPETGERPAFPHNTSYDPPTSPSETLLASQGHQTLSFDTYLEGMGGESIFPQVPAWQELMALRDQPDALNEALTRIKVPLTGLLLPFSQFQLQLEGHRYEEPFFNEPVEPLSLERLLPMIEPASQADFISADPSLVTSSFESTAPSVISAVAEGAQASSAKLSTQAIPMSVIILSLLVMLGAGAYFAGAHELLTVLFDQQEYVSPATQRASPVTPVTSVPPTDPAHVKPAVAPEREDLELVFDEPVEPDPMIEPAQVSPELTETPPPPPPKVTQRPSSKSNKRPAQKKTKRSPQEERATETVGQKIKLKRSARSADRVKEKASKPVRSSRSSTKRSKQRRAKKKSVPGLKSVF